MLDHMAVWTWPGAVSKEDPKRMVDRLKAAHVDIIIPYISRRAATSPELSAEAYEERLRAIVSEAHKQGLKVHGCFDEVNMYPAMPAEIRALNQVRKDGSTGTVLCHANPAVLDFVISELTRVLTDFDYDGINLEDGYIFNRNTVYDPANQPGQEYKVIPVCYCDHCRQHAPIDKPEWESWKQARLTGLIAAESRLIRSLKPGMPFSVAARMPYDRSFYAPFEKEIPYYGGWEVCQSRTGLAADWAGWLRRGLIDFACPMLYFHSLRLVELGTREGQHEIQDARRKVWVGMGLGNCTAEYGYGSVKDADPSLMNDAGSLGRLLDLQESLGQKNCVFFCYESLLDEHLPVLARYRKG